MIPPTFQIGDEVLITGPAEYGNEKHTGERFKIETYHKEGPAFGGRDLYSARGFMWYPASSLQLVKEIPMRITYNYKPDDAEHGTIQVSCPCGRKADIALPERSEWKEAPDELKIGDFVEVIGPCAPIYGTRSDDPKIFEIKSIFENGLCNGDMCRPSYPATSLRKLTPEEIKAHLHPIQVSATMDCSEFVEGMAKCQDKLWKIGIEARLSAIEKQQKEQHEKISQFDGEISHLMGSIQECLMESGDVEARTRCREMAIEKRLEFVEKIQRTEYKRNGSWAAGP